MRLKTKILGALASGPKFYKDLLKLAKNEKQLSSCLARMRHDKGVNLRVKDGENEYWLRGNGAASHVAAALEPSAARFSIDHRGTLSIRANGAEIELAPGEFSELRLFVEKTSEIHSPADA